MSKAPNKFLSMLLAVALVMSGLMVTPSLTAFAMDENHWSTSAVKTCQDYDILDDADKSYDPDIVITRAEFAGMVNRAFNFTKTEGAQIFTDVDYNSISSNDIKIASAMGYMEGYGDTFGPKDGLTREQAFSILSRIYLLSGGTETKTHFSDDALISTWARASMSAMTEAGYVNGTNSNMVNPQKQLTKGESAQVLWNLFGTIADNDLTDSAAVYKNLTVRKTGVTVKGATVTGDLFITDGVGNGDTTFENVTVGGRVLIAGGGPSSVSFKDSTMDNLVISGKWNTHAKLTGSTFSSLTFMASGKVTFNSAVITFDAASGKLSLAGTFDKIVENTDKTTTVTIGGMTFKIGFGADTPLKNLVKPSTDDVGSSGGGGGGGSDSNGGSNSDGGTLPVLPSITTNTLPNGVVNTPYNQTLIATGTTPIEWMITSGSLPNGLSLSSSGVISGEPTTIGETANFTVKAKNNAGSVTKAFTITISNESPGGGGALPVLPSITTETLQDGVRGTFYSQTLTAIGTTPITWTLDSGSLPEGLNLSESGEISGAPMTRGTADFTIKAQNEAGSDTKAFTITITMKEPPGDGGATPILPSITTNTLPNGVVDTPYSRALTATGTTPITWTIDGGSLPDGMSLSSLGVISGEPTTIGETANFTVKAENRAGSITKAFTITIKDKALKNTEDVIALTRIIEQVNANGLLVSENLDSLEYTWDEGSERLIEILWDNKRLSGSLDVSDLTALTMLDCSGNDLTKLNVSNLTFLTELYCPDNQLTDLVVSDLTALTVLDCSWNKLIGLNVNDLTFLTELYCSGNQLTELVVSGLTVLDCSSNQLMELDESGLTTLTKLDCSNNQLTKLDVNCLTALKELRCSDNLLTVLELSSLTALTKLNCSRNQLEELILSGLTALKELRCSENQLTVLDLSDLTALTMYSCGEGVTVIGSPW